LIAVNNTIALATAPSIQYFVDRGIVDLVRPLCRSLRINLRLQALWILGNLGTMPGKDGYKDAVVTLDTVQAFVEVRVLMYRV
jgi:hypothetical protein